jgi:WD40 repeat protein
MQVTIMRKSIRLGKASIQLCLAMMILGAALSGCSGSHSGQRYPVISPENAGQLTPLAVIPVGGFAGDIAWLSDDRIAVSTAQGISIYQIDSPEPLQVVPCCEHSYLDFDPENNILAAIVYGYNISLWDIEARTELGELHGHTASITEIRFSPDGRLLVSSSSDGTIRIWDVARREAIHILEEDQRGVWNLMMSPDGSFVVSAGLDGSAHFWDVATGDEIGASQPLIGFFTSLSPDGEDLLVMDGATGEVFLWPIEEGLRGEVENPVPLPLQSGSFDIGFSPNGTLIALGDLDNNVAIFDLADNEVLATLSGHSSLVLRVAFNPAGTLLASYAGRQDGTLRIWGVPQE